MKHPYIPLQIFASLFLFLAGCSVTTRLGATPREGRILSATTPNQTTPPTSGRDSIEVEIDDLGRLPESFDMAIDSLLNRKYKEYYTLGRRSKRPPSPATDALYRSRVQEMTKVIPLSYNNIVRECIEMYVNNRSTFLGGILAKSSYYFPIIEQEFDRLGVPLELKYLAIVESALNPTAVSRVGATGLWQFMLTTGKMYGLKIDSLIDERRDPIKSSQAAARYFKDMYAIYGDWLLVIAAYNCGPGNVNKAIRKAGGRTNYWSIYPYLPRETRSYVPFYIGAYYAMEYYREHGIQPAAFAPMPLGTDTIHVERRHSFRDLSDLTGVPIDTIRLLNPKYRREIIPGHSDPQIVVLPAGKAIRYSADKDSILASRPTLTTETRTTTLTHRVGRGETIAEIARRYSVDIEDLKSWNRLRSSKLKRGQILKILILTEVTVERDGASSTNENYGVVERDVVLTPAPTRTTAASKQKNKATKKKTYHTVKRGETLSSIAGKYRGVTVTQIRQANHIKGNKIRVGQRLVIPR